MNRGSTRGNSKSFFKSLFVADRQDEDGQVSTESVVGFFKGRISVYNENEKVKFETKKADLLNDIFECIKRIHMKRFEKELEFSMEDLEVRE